MPANKQHTKSRSQQIMEQINKLTTACLFLGLIVMVSSILVSIGLASGLFLSNSNVSVSLWTMNNYLKVFGVIICIITFISILVAKKWYHIPIKKPIVKTLASVFLIYVLPSIINSILWLMAQLNTIGQ